MTWLYDELPQAVIQALQLVGQNTSSSATSSSGTAPASDSADLNTVWLGVASQYPFTSLWPLALLLSLIALNLLTVLLVLTWRLAKASLSLTEVHKFSYSTSSPGRKIRKLKLPGNGAVLGLVLCASTAQVVEVVRWGSWGRLSWLDSVGQMARTVAFIAIWLSVLFVSASSIQSIPLFSSTSSLSIPVPRSLTLPIVHPILVDFVVLVLPFLLCIIPAFILLISNTTAINTFDAVLLNAQSSSNGTALTSNSTMAIIRDGFDSILTYWQIQGYGCTVAFLALLFIVLAVEMRAYARLGKVASFLAEAEAVSTSAQDESYHVDEKPISTLSRAYSVASRASGYRSQYSRRRPEMPDKLELDLPSPSLMKENGEYAYPALAYREDNEYGISEFGEKVYMPRRMASYSSQRSRHEDTEPSAVEYGDEKIHPYYQTSRPCTPARSLSRQSLHLPNMVRSRTYGSASSHSSRHSCSCGSSSSSSSSSYNAYGSKRPHSSGPYTGPSSFHIVQQRKTRIVDAGIMVGLLGLACIVEGLGALLKRTALEDRRLESAFQIAALLIQIVPTVGALLLSAIRDGGSAYGWSKDDEGSQDEYVYRM